MNYRIVLTLDADADIGSVFSWYQGIDPNLAARFISEGRTTMIRIAQFPYRFQPINGTVRRARLKRFPYGVYYLIDHDEVFITAILHLRRSRDIWRPRSRN
jgi:plasmid stabilization system protein ParE